MKAKTQSYLVKPQGKSPLGKKEASEQYRDYNPIPISPLNEQFEPTDVEPIPQHAKMAGC